MLLVSYAACDGKAVVAWFTVAMSFMSAHSVGVKVTVHDLSPTYGGSLIELVDGFGNISGMMVPYFVGLIVNHVLTQSMTLSPLHFTTIFSKASTSGDTSFGFHFSPTPPRALAF
jgi:hypothetical protein